MSNGPRHGLVLGDLLLVVSVLALAAALAYPRYRRAAFNDRLDRIGGEVEAVVEAARRLRTDEDRWPEPTDPGQTPPELVAYLPGGFSFDGEGYRLDLEVWETAQEAPSSKVTEPNLIGGEPDVVPDTTATTPAALFGSLAAVQVHTEQTPLLAGLLDRYGDQRSFVFGDVWTLVFASVPGR